MLVTGLAFGALLVFGALVAAPRARAEAAEAPTVALRYRASRACPSEAQLAREVDAMLGRSAFVAGGAFVLDVDVATDPTHAQITLVGPDGATLGLRRVEIDGACRSLLGPLALVVALLVELPAERTEVRITLPSHVAPDVAPEEAPEVTREGSAVEVVAAEQTVAREAAEQGLPTSLALLGGVELGLGPEPAALVGLGLGVAPLRELALHLDLIALPFAVLQGAEVGLERSTIAGFFDVCVSAWGGRMEPSLAFCADVGFGASFGSGRQLDVGRTAVVAWLVAGAALRMQVPIDATWFVGGWLRAGANLVQPTFVYQDPLAERVVVLRASLFEASGGLALGVRWAS